MAKRKGCENCLPRINRHRRALRRRCFGRKQASKDSSRHGRGQLWPGGKSANGGKPVPGRSRVWVNATNGEGSDHLERLSRGTKKLRRLHTSLHYRCAGNG